MERENTLPNFVWKLSKGGKFLFCPNTKRETERETDKEAERQKETQRQRQKQRQRSKSVKSWKKHARTLCKDIPGFQS